MTNLNNKLLSIFLIFGILFFGAVIFLFVKNELPKEMRKRKHDVVLGSVHILKNDFVDTALIRKVHLVSEQLRYQEDSCIISMVNLTDSIAYVESNQFNLMTTEPPKTISFYGSRLPQPALKDKFKLVFKCKSRSLFEIPLGNLDLLLDLENKKDGVEESKEIKLTSPDKKVIMHVNFTVL